MAGQAVPMSLGNHQALARYSYTEYHMGVDTRLVVYADNKDTAEKACAAAFERIAQLDSIMSDYQIRSEAMQLCDKAGAPPVKVSDDLFRVLEESLEISRQSDGLFDVSVGPLVRLWRRAKKTGVIPSHEALESARKLVDWKKIRLNSKDRTVQLLEPGMKLDFGAIGKGYADDEAQKVLKRSGIDRALVEMGGDIVMSGPPLGETGWLVEVPNAEQGERVPKLRLHDCAISTSGDTEEFVIIAGKRYSHVINPHTGQALTQRVQATVIAKEGWLSDPLSTALTLLDRKGRHRILRDHPGTKSFVKVLALGDTDRDNK